MRLKYFFIGGIIIVAIIFGLFFNFLEDVEYGSIPDLMYIVPSVEIEATIISLSPSELSFECEESEVCPRDSAILKVDKIDRVGDPHNRVDIKVGDELGMSFEYSARPAKLRWDESPYCSEGLKLESGSCVDERCSGSGCGVSSPQYNEKPTEMEGSYIVYHLRQRNDGITEEILPGLKEGSRIKIKIWDIPSFKIGKYDLI